MPRSSDEQALKELRAFRPNAQPIVMAVIANVVLAGLCLGIPYQRGKIQAEHSLQAFSVFAACMLGGRAQQGSGLGLPPGERAHFAANVMAAGDDWPKRCNTKLDAIAPEEAIFLWPSVKQAGADLRAVVALLRQELAQVERQRASSDRGRVPERPLLALAKLRAGLTLMAQATSTDDGIDGNAVVFDRAPSIAQPARLPLAAAATAALDVWAGQDGLEALAMDRRGISWLRIEGGKVDRQRVKRTGLVRATLRGEQQPYVVWAMPPEKCAELEDRCVRRATGVAHHRHDAAQLPTPTWLGGHPAGRPDRSLRLGIDEHTDLLALASTEGALEVRRYALGPPRGEDAPPLRPTARWPLPSGVPPHDALLLPDEPRAVAYATTGPEGSRYWLWPYTAGTPPELLASDEHGAPWLASCRAEHTRWLLLGTDSSALQLLGLRTDGVRIGPHRAALRVDEPVHDNDPAGDRFRMLCDDDGVTLIAVTPDRRLAQLHCGTSGCVPRPDVTSNVARFDATRHRDKIVVAYTIGTQPRVRVTRLGTDGKPVVPAASPAACWDPPSGMCGQPTLSSDGARLLLSARDGSDLLTIESEDGGDSWTTMSGLQVSTAPSTDVSAPMDQHRIRKGIERHP